VAGLAHKGGRKWRPWGLFSAPFPPEPNPPSGRFNPFFGLQRRPLLTFSTFKYTRKDLALEETKTAKLPTWFLLLVPGQPLSQP
jgi:hypothetical protein